MSAERYAPFSVLGGYVVLTMLQRALASLPMRASADLTVGSGQPAPDAAQESSTNASLQPVPLDEPSPDSFRVLILGDGNFSFSLALARLATQDEPSLVLDEFFKLKGVQGETAEHDDDDEGNEQDRDSSNADGTARPRLELICTSFDSRPELVEKYPETRVILQKLEAYTFVTVLHEINAWQIPLQFPGHQFDAIVWNHPHLGVEDFRLHRFLMAHFFQSVAKALKPTGFVSVSLVQGQEERWTMTEQAKRFDLGIKTFTRFYPEQWPGYETRRNRTGNSFQNHQTQKHTGHRMRSFLYQYHFGPDLARVDEGRGTDQATAAGLTNATTPQAADRSVGFECAHCGKVFSSDRGVRTHIRQVHELKKYGNDWKPQRPRQLSCQICNKSFPDKEAQWQHVVAKHSFDQEIKPQGPLTAPEQESGQHVHYIPCSVCGQAVPSHWHMDQHLEMLKPLVGMRANCKLCHKVFTEHRALRQHLNFCRLKEGEELPEHLKFKA